LGGGVAVSPCVAAATGTILLFVIVILILKIEWDEDEHDDENDFPALFAHGVAVVPPPPNSKRNFCKTGTPSIARREEV
jgi:hypothetical protein